MSQTPYTVTERGLHHKVWQRVTWSTNEAGILFSQTNSYTELATGMAHYNRGRLLDSSGEISVTPTGAQATNAMHSLTFLGNINGGWPVDVIFPDGRHLASRPLGLSYFDYSTRKSVWIGEITDSYGQLLPSKNQGLYPDAFSGGIVADLLYENSPSSFEQSVIIRSQVPSPNEWGLDPDSTVLQVITEFTNFPTPQVTHNASVLRGDDDINFGAMRMGSGAAFALGDENNRIPATKHWAVLDGRQCLIEQIPYPAISNLLENLPPPPPSHASVTSPDSFLHRVVFQQKPPEHKVHSRQPEAFTVALSPLAGKGLVADYQLLTSQDSLTLQGDTTYYISDTVNVTNLIIEGGSVIKYTNNAIPSLCVFGPVTCKTGPYRMAVFTSKDDNSIGDQINGSTSFPSNYTAGYAQLYVTTSNVLSYLRFSYAMNAVWQQRNSLNPVWNCQFLNCGYALRDNSSSNYFVQELHNVLFSKCSCPFYSPVSYWFTWSIAGEQVTIDQADALLMSRSGAQSSVYLTNSILTGIGSYPSSATIILSNCCLAGTNSGIFRTVGGAAYYLADSSTNRNAGTTGINPALLAAIRQKTTYPPIVLDAVTITNNQTFSPQAQRDTDAPDIGWHYDPVDFVIKTTILSNATVQVLPGTAIGTVGLPGNGGGFGLYSGATLVCHGTATSPCHFISYDTVHEHSNTNWDGLGWVTYIYGSNVTTSFSFTECIATLSKCFFYVPLSPRFPNGSHSFLNCSFHGGSLITYNGALTLTNNLFDRARLYISDCCFDQSIPLSVRNCLFFGGTVNLTHRKPPAWIFRDNLFDNLTISEYNYATLDANYNAYTPGSARLTPTNVNDVVLTSPLVYQSGPLGNYYQPNNNPLINAGSTTADLAGLYHFTVLTNQIKETDSIVDIGFHYVATDANGNPLDSDGDGTADYIEDANGNGKVDSGDTDWQDPNDLGLKVIITRPTNKSTIP